MSDPEPNVDEAPPELVPAADYGPAPMAPPAEPPDPGMPQPVDTTAGMEQSEAHPPMPDDMPQLQLMTYQIPESAVSPTRNTSELHTIHTDFISEPITQMAYTSYPHISQNDYSSELHISRADYAEEPHISQADYAEEPHISQADYAEEPHLSQADYAEEPHITQAEDAPAFEETRQLEEVQQPVSYEHEYRADTPSYVDAEAEHYERGDKPAGIETDLSESTADTQQPMEQVVVPVTTVAPSAILIGHGFGITVPPQEYSGIATGMPSSLLHLTGAGKKKKKKKKKAGLFDELPMNSEPMLSELRKLEEKDKKRSPLLPTPMKPESDDGVLLSRNEDFSGPGPMGGPHNEDFSGPGPMGGPHNEGFSGQGPMGVPRSEDFSGPGPMRRPHNEDFSGPGPMGGPHNEDFSGPGPMGGPHNEGFSGPGQMGGPHNEGFSGPGPMGVPHSEDFSGPGPMGGPHNEGFSGPGPMGVPRSEDFGGPGPMGMPHNEDFSGPGPMGLHHIQDFSGPMGGRGRGQQNVPRHGPGPVFGNVPRPPKPLMGDDFDFSGFRSRGRGGFRGRGRGGFGGNFDGPPEEFDESFRGNWRGRGDRGRPFARHGKYKYPDDFDEEDFEEYDSSSCGGMGNEGQGQWGQGHFDQNPANFGPRGFGPRPRGNFGPRGPQNFNQRPNGPDNWGPGGRPHRQWGPGSFRQQVPADFNQGPGEFHQPFPPPPPGFPPPGQEGFHGDAFPPGPPQAPQQDSFTGEVFHPDGFDPSAPVPNFPGGPAPFQPGQLPPEPMNPLPSTDVAQNLIAQGMNPSLAKILNEGVHIPENIDSSPEKGKKKKKKKGQNTMENEFLYSDTPAPPPPTIPLPPPEPPVQKKKKKKKRDRLEGIIMPPEIPLPPPPQQPKFEGPELPPGQPPMPPEPSEVTEPLPNEPLPPTYDSTGDYFQAHIGHHDQQIQQAEQFAGVPPPPIDSQDGTNEPHQDQTLVNMQQPPVPTDHVQQPSGVHEHAWQQNLNLPTAVASEVKSKPKPSLLRPQYLIEAQQQAVAPELVQEQPLLPYQPVPTTEVVSSPPVKASGRRSRFDQSWQPSHVPPSVPNQTEPDIQIQPPSIMADVPTVVAPSSLIQQQQVIVQEMDEAQPHFSETDVPSLTPEQMQPTAQVYDQIESMEAQSIQDELIEMNQQNVLAQENIQTPTVTEMDQEPSDEANQRIPQDDTEAKEGDDGYVYYGNIVEKKEEKKESVPPKEQITASQLLEKFKMKQKEQKADIGRSATTFPAVIPAPISQPISQQKILTKEEKITGKFTFAIRKLKQLEAEKQEEEKQAMIVNIAGNEKDDGSGDAKNTTKVKSDAKDERDKTQDERTKAKHEEKEKYKKDKSESRRHKSRSRSNERDHKRRSQSTERHRRHKSKSLSADRDRKRKSRSRSYEKNRRSQSKSKSEDRSKRHKSRSRSYDKDRRRRSRSRSYGRDRYRCDSYRRSDDRHGPRSRYDRDDRYSRRARRSCDQSSDREQSEKRSDDRSYDRDRSSQDREQENKDRTKGRDKDRKSRSKSRSLDREHRRDKRSKSATYENLENIEKPTDVNENKVPTTTDGMDVSRKENVNIESANTEPNVMPIEKQISTEVSRKCFEEVFGMDHAATCSEEINEMKTSELVKTDIRMEVELPREIKSNQELNIEITEKEIKVENDDSTDVDNLEANESKISVQGKDKTYDTPQATQEKESDDSTLIKKEKSLVPPDSEMDKYKEVRKVVKSEECSKHETDIVGPTKLERKLDGSPVCEDRKADKTDRWQDDKYRRDRDRSRQYSGQNDKYSYNKGHGSKHADSYKSDSGDERLHRSQKENRKKHRNASSSERDNKSSAARRKEKMSTQDISESKGDYIEQKSIKAATKSKWDSSASESEHNASKPVSSDRMLKRADQTSVERDRQRRIDNTSASHNVERRMGNKDIDDEHRVKREKAKRIMEKEKSAPTKIKKKHRNEHDETSESEDDENYEYSKKKSQKKDKSHKKKNKKEKKKQADSDSDAEPLPKEKKKKKTKKKKKIIDEDISDDDAKTKKGKKGQKMDKKKRQARSESLDKESDMEVSDDELVKKKNKRREYQMSGSDDYRRNRKESREKERKRRTKYDSDDENEYSKNRKNEKSKDKFGNKQYNDSDNESANGRRKVRSIKTKKEKQYASDHSDDYSRDRKSKTKQKDKNRGRFVNDSDDDMDKRYKRKSDTKRHQDSDESDEDEYYKKRILKTRGRVKTPGTDSEDERKSLKDKKKEKEKRKRHRSKSEIPDSDESRSRKKYKLQKETEKVSESMEMRKRGKKSKRIDDSESDTSVYKKDKYRRKDRSISLEKDKSQHRTKEFTKQPKKQGSYDSHSRSRERDKFIKKRDKKLKMQSPSPDRSKNRRIHDSSADIVDDSREQAITKSRKSRKMKSAGNSSSENGSGDEKEFIFSKKKVSEHEHKSHSKMKVKSHFHSSSEDSDNERPRKNKREMERALRSISKDSASDKYREEKVLMEKLERRKQEYAELERKTSDSFKKGRDESMELDTSPRSDAVVNKERRHKMHDSTDEDSSSSEERKTGHVVDVKQISSESKHKQQDLSEGEVVTPEHKQKRRNLSKERSSSVDKKYTRHDLIVEKDNSERRQHDNSAEITSKEREKKKSKGLIHYKERDFSRDGHDVKKRDRKGSDEESRSSSSSSSSSSDSSSSSSDSDDDDVKKKRRKKRFSDSEDEYYKKNRGSKNVQAGTSSQVGLVPGTTVSEEKLGRCSPTIVSSSDKPQKLELACDDIVGESKTDMLEHVDADKPNVKPEESFVIIPKIDKQEYDDRWSDSDSATASGLRLLMSTYNNDGYDSGDKGSLKADITTGRTSHTSRDCEKHKVNLPELKSENIEIDYNASNSNRVPMELDIKSNETCEDEGLQTTSIVGDHIHVQKSESTLSGTMPQKTFEESPQNKLESKEEETSSVSEKPVSGELYDPFELDVSDESDAASHKSPRGIASREDKKADASVENTSTDKPANETQLEGALHKHDTSKVVLNEYGTKLRPENIDNNIPGKCLPIGECEKPPVPMTEAVIPQSSDISVLGYGTSESIQNQPGSIDFQQPVVPLGTPQTLQGVPCLLKPIFPIQVPLAIPSITTVTAPMFPVPSLISTGIGLPAPVGVSNIPISLPLVLPSNIDSAIGIAKSKLEQVQITNSTLPSSIPLPAESSGYTDKGDPILTTVSKDLYDPFAPDAYESPPSSPVKDEDSIAPSEPVKAEGGKVVVKFSLSAGRKFFSKAAVSLDEDEKPINVPNVKSSSTPSRKSRFSDKPEPPVFSSQTGDEKGHGILPEKIEAETALVLDENEKHLCDASATKRKSRFSDIPAPQIDSKQPVVAEIGKADKLNEILPEKLPFESGVGKQLLSMKVDENKQHAYDLSKSKRKSRFSDKADPEIASSQPGVALVCDPKLSQILPETLLPGVATPFNRSENDRGKFENESKINEKKPHKNKEDGDKTVDNEGKDSNYEKKDPDKASENKARKTKDKHSFERDVKEKEKERESYRKRTHESNSSKEYRTRIECQEEKYEVDRHGRDRRSNESDKKDRGRKNDNESDSRDKGNRKHERHYKEKEYESEDIKEKILHGIGDDRKSQRHSSDSKNTDFETQSFLLEAGGLKTHLDYIQETEKVIPSSLASLDKAISHEQVDRTAVKGTDNGKLECSGTSVKTVVSAPLDMFMRVDEEVSIKMEDIDQPPHNIIHHQKAKSEERVQWTVDTVKAKSEERVVSKTLSPISQDIVRDRSNVFDQFSPQKQNEATRPETFQKLNISPETSLIDDANITLESKNLKMKTQNEQDANSVSSRSEHTWQLTPRGLYKFSPKKVTPHILSKELDNCPVVKLRDLSPKKETVHNNVFPNDSKSIKSENQEYVSHDNNYQIQSNESETKKPEKVQTDSKQDVATRHVTDSLQDEGNVPKGHYIDDPPSKVEDKVERKPTRDNKSKEPAAIPKRLTRRLAAEQKVVLPPVMSKDMPTRARKGRKSVDHKDISTDDRRYDIPISEDDSNSQNSVNSSPCTSDSQPTVTDLKFTDSETDADLEGSSVKELSNASEICQPAIDLNSGSDLSTLQSSFSVELSDLSVSGQESKEVEVCSDIHVPTESVTAKELSDRSESNTKVDADFSPKERSSFIELTDNSVSEQASKNSDKCSNLLPMDQLENSERQQTQFSVKEPELVEPQVSQLSDPLSSLPISESPKYVSEVLPLKNQHLGESMESTQLTDSPLVQSQLSEPQSSLQKNQSRSGLEIPCENKQSQVDTLSETVHSAGDNIGTLPDDVKSDVTVMEITSSSVNIVAKTEVILSNKLVCTEKMVQKLVEEPETPVHVQDITIKTSEEPAPHAEKVVRETKVEQPKGLLSKIAEQISALKKSNDSMKEALISPEKHRERKISGPDSEKSLKVETIYCTDVFSDTKEAASTSRAEPVAATNEPSNKKHCKVLKFNSSDAECHSSMPVAKGNKTKFFARKDQQKNLDDSFDISTSGKVVKKKIYIKLSDSSQVLPFSMPEFQSSVKQIIPKPDRHATAADSTSQAKLKISPLVSQSTETGSPIQVIGQETLRKIEVIGQTISKVIEQGNLIQKLGKNPVSSGSRAMQIPVLGISSRVSSTVSTDSHADSQALISDSDKDDVELGVLESHKHHLLKMLQYGDASSVDDINANRQLSEQPLFTPSTGKKDDKSDDYELSDGHYEGQEDKRDYDEVYDKDRREYGRERREYGHHDERSRDRHDDRRDRDSKRERRESRDDYYKHKSRSERSDRSRERDSRRRERPRSRDGSRERRHKKKKEERHRDRDHDSRRRRRKSSRSRSRDRRSRSRERRSRSRDRRSRSRDHDHRSRSHDRRSRSRDRDRRSRSRDRRSRSREHRSRSRDRRSRSRERYRNRRSRSQSRDRSREREEMEQEKGELRRKGDENIADKKTKESALEKFEKELAEKKKDQLQSPMTPDAMGQAVSSAAISLEPFANSPDFTGQLAVNPNAQFLPSHFPRQQPMPTFVTTPEALPPSGPPPPGFVNYPVDPNTGYYIDPGTGMPVDPNTGILLQIDPNTGMPCLPPGPPPGPPPMGMPPHAGMPLPPGPATFPPGPAGMPLPPGPATFPPGPMPPGPPPPPSGFSGAPRPPFPPNMDMPFPGPPMDPSAMAPPCSMPGFSRPPPPPAPFNIVGSISHDNSASGPPPPPPPFYGNVREPDFHGQVHEINVYAENERHMLPSGQFNQVEPGTYYQEGSFVSGKEKFQKTDMKIKRQNSREDKMKPLLREEKAPKKSRFSPRVDLEAPTLKPSTPPIRQESSPGIVSVSATSDLQQETFETATTPTTPQVKLETTDDVKSTPESAENEKTAAESMVNVEAIAASEGTVSDPVDQDKITDTTVKENEEQDTTKLPMQLAIDMEMSEVSDSDTSTGGMPMKVKSRWRRASEAEKPPTQSLQTDADGDTPDALLMAKDDEGQMSEATNIPKPPEVEDSGRQTKEENKEEEKKEAIKEKDDEIPIDFEIIDENVYLFERKRSKQMREVRRMVCDCTTSKEDREMSYDACGEDCLNRMLFIECGSKCPCGEYCTNRKFHNKQNSNVAPFKTDWKGHGLQALEDVQPGQFVMEYVGEVLDNRLFRSRAKQYSKAGQQHFYFMAINPEEVIDATIKGNISRFINHSCDPNCETQKWTVNGILRVGFFVKKTIAKGEELTFDYQYEIYGKEAQKCFCGTDLCRGFIGGSKSFKSGKKGKTNEEEEEEVATVIDAFEETDKLEEEIEEMSELEQGLRNKEDVLNICRLMVRAEDPEHRKQILKVLENTTEGACLRLFLDYHGLPLLWSWMADVKQITDELKTLTLQILEKLPITNKTILVDSKILDIVERWAVAASSVDASEINEPASETTEDEGEPLPLPPVTSNKTPVSILMNIRDIRCVKKKVKFADENSSSDSESRTSASELDISENTEVDVATASLKAKKKRESMELRLKVLDKKEGHQFHEAGDLDKEDDDVDSTNDTEAEAKEPEQDAEEEVAEEKPEEDLQTLASKLLARWADLKEVYKIPKKQVLEERKRTERELDAAIQKTGKTKPSGWDRGWGRKRKRESSYNKDDTDDSDSASGRKTLLATPTKLSKSERRQQFEANVKAQEELSAEREREQERLRAEQVANEALIQAQHQQQLMADPNFLLYAIQDPNFLPSIGIDTAQFIQQVAMDHALLQHFIAINPQFPQQLEHLTLLYQNAALQAAEQFAQSVGMATTDTFSGLLDTPATGDDDGEPDSEQHLAFLQQVEAFKQKHLEPSETAPSSTTEEDVPPPPSPPQGKPVVLPPNWKTAIDAEGKMYYYHTVTRQTQWDPPTLDQGDYDEMDLGTPSQEEIITKSSKRKTTTAAADTSSETSKKLKEAFKTKMSSWIVVCLNPFRKNDCKEGRITSTDDFKHLARKLTHHVMAKELKHCRHVEDLEVNENVKSKAKDFVRKYMVKYGVVYKRSGNSPNYD